MRTSTTLRTRIPANLFPLSATFFQKTEDLNDYGQRLNAYVETFTAKCLFTTGVRGAARDFGLRKDDREHVRTRGSILIDALVDIEYGDHVQITWPDSEWPGGKTETWRVVAPEHRPISPYTRCAIEQFDGSTRG